MRDIKFRGKSKENGRWYYGYYCKENNNAWFKEEYVEKHYIRFQENMDWNLTQQMLEEVDENTVGQYIGLKDKYDVDIYEGDIVKVFTSPYYQKGYVKYNENKGRYDIGWLSEVENYKNNGLIGSMAGIDNDYEPLEVIGNIYDNKELLDK